MKNNSIKVVGNLVSDFVYDYNFNNEGFYNNKISISRTSGQADILKIIISENLLRNIDCINSRVSISGELRTRNFKVDGKSKLDIYIFVQAIENAPNAVDTNALQLTGYICKTPIFRETPFGRNITDMLLAVNRYCKRSDYIPCIAWGRHAQFVKNLDIGTKLTLLGRLQSRQYTKTIDNTVETKVAYEVSITDIQLLEDEDA